MVPTIETSRLILRGIQLSDAPSYQKHFNDYAVISQLAPIVPWPYPDNGAEDFIRNIILPQQGKDRWFWGIFLNENPEELIGAVDIWRTGKPENRGFWLGRSFWGHGYMTEAVEPLMDYCFEHLGFETLVFSNALGNIKSRRIKEKTGARLIGIRPAKFVSSEYTEAETWELTKDDWKKFKLNHSQTNHIIKRAAHHDAKGIIAAHRRSIREVRSVRFAPEITIQNRFRFGQAGILKKTDGAKQ